MVFVSFWISCQYLKIGGGFLYNFSYLGPWVLHSTSSCPLWTAHAHSSPSLLLLTASLIPRATTNGHFHNNSDIAPLALLMYLTCYAPDLNLWPYYLLWSMLGKEGEPQKNVCSYQATWKADHRTLSTYPHVAVSSKWQSSPDLSVGEYFSEAKATYIVSFFPSEERPTFRLSNERIFLNVCFCAFFNVEIKSTMGEYT